MTYVVKPGDTVSGILKALGSSSYGSRDSWEAVRAANGLNSSYVLRVGQTINIPDNLVSAQATPAPNPTPVANPGSIAGSTAPGAGGVGFGDVLKFKDYSSPELAQSAAAQRSARYYDPLVDESQRTTLAGYATRNLGRSGMRGRDILKMYQDYADEEKQMRDKLFGEREKEAIEGYNQERARYEENPTGYTKPTTNPNTNYEYKFPDESPQKYSQSYRDWLREAYKM